MYLFSSTVVEDTKIICGFNFVAPLKIYVKELSFRKEASVVVVYLNDDFFSARLLKLKFETCCGT